MSKIEVTKLATLTGHRDCVYTLEQGLLPATFFSAAGDGQVVQWCAEDEPNGLLIAGVDRSVYALKLLKERGLLLVGHNFNGIQVIDVAEKKLLKSVALPPVAIFDIAYSVELKRVFVGLADGSLVMLDDENFEVKEVLRATEKSLRTLALNPKTGELAAAYSDFSIRIFDAQTLKLRHLLQGHTNSVFTVAFSPDGKFLLSGGRDAHLRIWDCENNYAEAQAIVAHMFTINHIAFSPDGKYFATCSMDKSIKVWDAATFKLLKVIDKARNAGHGTSVNKLFWTGNQNRLVSCSDDRTIQVWELNFGLRYENHSVRDQAENI